MKDFKAHNNPKAFPVYVIANTLQYAVEPKSQRIFIDTYGGVGGAPGLTFQDRHGNRRTIRSDSSGRGLEDAAFFLDEVLRYAQADHLDIRPYSRDTLSGYF